MPTGTDLAPVGLPGVLNLNGVESRRLPFYQIAQFPSRIPGAGTSGRRLALVACTLYLNQDWVPVLTKYQFDAWNADDVKLTGAFRCADSWHESPSGTDPTLNTGIRFRVQGVKSTQCFVNGESVPTEAVGVIAVESMRVDFDASTVDIGTTLASAGKATGKIVGTPRRRSRKAASGSRTSQLLTSVAAFSATR